MGEPPNEKLPVQRRQEVRLRVTHHPSRSTHDTVRLPVETITCVRMDGDAFPFGTSFLMPQALKMLKRRLADYRKLLIDEHPEYRFTIFGHTDSEGGDRYNKELSGRRAETVIAFVLQMADKWEFLYNEEKWGPQIIKVILRALGESADAGTVGMYTAGGGAVGRRRSLFLRYMRHSDYSIDDGYFFTNDALRSVDPVCIGCGAYNPIKDHRVHDFPNKEERRQLNGVNRRVTIFWWRGNGPNKFPDCGKVDCSGARNRAALPGAQQFRCAFYWRHFAPSKCEEVKPNPTRSGCVKLKKLYEYLVEKRQKSIYECTLLRILHKCFELEEGKFLSSNCARKGIDWWILHPFVYNDFFKTPGSFPYQTGFAPDVPQHELFRYRPRNQLHKDEIKWKLDGGSLPQELRRKSEGSRLPISPEAGGPVTVSDNCWWITDLKNKFGKQMFQIDAELTDDFWCCRLDYTQMIGATVSSSHIDTYGRLTPVNFAVNVMGAYDDAEISVREFFENRVNPATGRPGKPHYARRLNYVKDELFRIIFGDEGTYRDGQFDPSITARKLTQPPEGSPTNLMYGYGDSIIPYVENHIFAVNRRLEMVLNGQSGFVVMAQWQVYYRDKLKDRSSIYSCFRHGSREVKNSFWRGDDEVLKDNRCKDATRKCDPAECLGMNGGGLTFRKRSELPIR